MVFRNNTPHRRQRVNDTVSADDGAGEQNSIAAYLGVITHNSPKFSKAGFNNSAPVFHLDLFFIGFQVGNNYTCSKMGTIPQHLITHVIEMGNLSLVEDDGIFDLG